MSNLANPCPREECHAMDPANIPQPFVIDKNKTTEEVLREYEKHIVDRTEHHLGYCGVRAISPLANALLCAWWATGAWQGRRTRWLIFLHFGEYAACDAWRAAPSTALCGTRDRVRVPFHACSVACVCDVLPALTPRPSPATRTTCRMTTRSFSPSSR